MYKKIIKIFNECTGASYLCRCVCVLFELKQFSQQEWQINSCLLALYSKILITIFSKSIVFFLMA